MSIRQEKRTVTVESDQCCFPHEFTLTDLRRNQHGTQKRILEDVCRTCRIIGTRFCITDFWSGPRIDPSSDDVRQRHPDFGSGHLNVRTSGEGGFVDGRTKGGSRKKRRN